MQSLYGDKKDCCGCAACADACPKHCISMQIDREDSFLYPKIDASSCIDCGKCKRVCPIKNAETRKEKVANDDAFALRAKDSELLRKSSSGGAFSTIMDAFVQRCGNDEYAIFGATFDKTTVAHAYRQERSQADVFLKSKYLQSDARGAYGQVKKFLDRGVWVLFSGTPCLVAGLKGFLGKDYERLLTVDIICHGVPSQRHFDDYLAELEKDRGDRVKKVGFRHKVGFEPDSSEPADSRNVIVEFENGEPLVLSAKTSSFLKGFHQGLFYRESCYHCPFATPQRVGDVTLGDFWQNQKVAPDWDPHRGLSLIRNNTERGREVFKTVVSQNNAEIKDASYIGACKWNAQLHIPAIGHTNRRKFQRLYNVKKISFSQCVAQCQRITGLDRLRAFPHRTMCKIKSKWHKIVFRLFPFRS